MATLPGIPCFARLLQRSPANNFARDLGPEDFLRAQKLWETKECFASLANSSAQSYTSHGKRSFVYVMYRSGPEVLVLSASNCDSGEVLLDGATCLAIAMCKQRGCCCLIFDLRCESQMFLKPCILAFDVYPNVCVQVPDGNTCQKRIKC